MARSVEDMQRDSSAVTANYLQMLRGPQAETPQPGMAPSGFMDFTTFAKQQAAAEGRDANALFGEDNYIQNLRAAYRDTVLPSEMLRSMDPKTPRSMATAEVERAKYEFDSRFDSMLPALRQALTGVAPGAEPGSKEYTAVSGARDVLAGGVGGASETLLGLASLLGQVPYGIGEFAGTLTGNKELVEAAKAKRGEVVAGAGQVSQDVVQPIKTAIMSERGREAEQALGAELDRIKDMPAAEQATAVLAFLKENPAAMVGIAGQAIGSLAGGGVATKAVTSALRSTAGGAALLKRMEEAKSLVGRAGRNVGLGAPAVAPGLGALQTQAYNDAVAAGLTPEQAARAANEVITDPTVLGAYLAATSLGAETSRMFTGVGRAGAGGVGGAVRGAVTGLPTEAIPEGIQGAAEQRAVNLALGRPESQGVAASGMLEAAGAAVPGTVVGGIEGARGTPAATPPPPAATPPAAGTPAPTQQLPTGNGPGGAAAPLTPAPVTPNIPEAAVEFYQTGKADEWFGKVAADTSAMKERFDTIAERVRDSADTIPGWDQLNAQQQQEFIDSTINAWATDPANKVNPRQFNDAMQAWQSQRTVTAPEGTAEQVAQTLEATVGQQPTATPVQTGTTQQVMEDLANTAATPPPLPPPLPTPSPLGPRRRPFTDAEIATSAASADALRQMAEQRSLNQQAQEFMARMQGREAARGGPADPLAAAAAAQAGRQFPSIEPPLQLPPPTGANTEDLPNAVGLLEDGRVVDLSTGVAYQSRQELETQRERQGGLARMQRLSREAAVQARAADNNTKRATISLLVNKLENLLSAWGRSRKNSETRDALEQELGNTLFDIDAVGMQPGVEFAKTIDRARKAAGDYAPKAPDALKKKVIEGAATDAGVGGVLNPWDFADIKDGESLLRRYIDIGKDPTLKTLARLLMLSPRAREVRVTFIDMMSALRLPQNISAAFQDSRIAAYAAVDEESANVYFRKDSPTAFTEDTIVHEMIHALTFHALYKNQRAANELQSISRAITAALERVAPQYVGYWKQVGQDQPAEVLTYMLTHPTLARFAQQFAADGRPLSEVDLNQSPELRAGQQPRQVGEAPRPLTLWDRILDFVRRLFGMQPTAQVAFNRAMEEHTAMLEQVRQEQLRFDSVRTLDDRLSEMLKELVRFTNVAGATLRIPGRMVGARTADTITPEQAQKQVEQRIAERVTSMKTRASDTGKQVSDPASWFVKHFVEKRVAVRNLMFEVARRFGSQPKDNAHLYDGLVRYDSKSSVSTKQASQDILMPLAEKITAVRTRFKDMTEEDFLANLELLFENLHGIERNEVLRYEKGDITEVGGSIRRRLMDQMYAGKISGEEWRAKMAANYAKHGTETEDQFKAAGKYTTAQMRADLQQMARMGFNIELAEEFRKELDEAREFVIRKAQEDGSFTLAHQNLLRARGWKYYFPLKTPMRVEADPLARTEGGTSRHIGSVHQELEGRETEAQRPLAQLQADVLTAAQAPDQNEYARTVYNFVQEYNEKMKLGVKIKEYTNTLDQGPVFINKNGKVEKLSLSEALSKNSVIYKTGDKYYVMSFPEGDKVIEGIKAVATVHPLLDTEFSIPVWFNGKKIETPSVAQAANVRARALTNWWPVWTLTKEFVRTMQTYGAFIYQEFGATGALDYFRRVTTRGGWAPYYNVVFDGTRPRTIKEIRDLSIAGNEAAGKVVELMEQGGFAEFAQRLNPERITQDIQSELAKQSANPLTRGLRGAGKWWVERMDALSTMVDLSTRLAAYETAKDTMGYSPAKAAAFAKKLFDFQQGGLNSATLNVFFTFFRSSLTSLDRQWQGFKDEQGRVRWSDPRVRRGAAAMAALGGFWYMLSMALWSMAGGDPDDIEKIEDEVFTNNLVLPLTGPNEDPIIVPLGYQLPQMMFGLGVLSARMANGHTDYQSYLNTMASTIMRNATPLNVNTQPNDGFYDFLKNTAEAGFRATLAGPFIEAYNNENSYGDPIARIPGQGQYRSEAGKFTTPESYKNLARYLRNYMGFDIQPEMLEHVLSGYAGQLGVQPVRVMDWMIYGNDNPNAPYPILPKWTTRSGDFYESRELDRAIDDLNGMVKEYSAMVAEKGEAAAKTKFEYNPQNKRKLDLLKRMQSLDTKQRKAVKAIQDNALIPRAQRFQMIEMKTEQNRKEIAALLREYEAIR